MDLKKEAQFSKNLRKLNFPNDFLWGVATAAHQIEGNNHYSDWWQFEKEGKINDGSSSDQGRNSYKNFDKDLELLKKLNVNAYRFSIEWARLEPQKSHWDSEALEYYRYILTNLRENKIEPIVGLHHITLPYWAAKVGGWENNKIIDWITRYTEFICKKLGNSAQYWTTITEPQTVVLVGYLLGYWPPEKKSIIGALRATNHINKAHRGMFRIIKKYSPDSRVGIVNNLPAFKPLSLSFHDKLLAKLISDINLKLFIEPNIKYSDFLGLNYYIRPKIGLTFSKEWVPRSEGDQLPSEMRIKLLALPRLNLIVDLRGRSKIISDWGWGVYPEGLTKIVNRLSKYNLPIIITENGIADAKDRVRSRFILKHLKVIQELIKKGADIKGYFHWTLADNFEWREGFSAKLGLANENRVLRKSGKFYSNICKSNSIEI